MQSIILFIHSYILFINFSIASIMPFNVQLVLKASKNLLPFIKQMCIPPPQEQRISDHNHCSFLRWVDGPSYPLIITQTDPAINWGRTLKSSSFALMLKCVYNSRYLIEQSASSLCETAKKKHWRGSGKQPTGNFPH